MPLDPAPTSPESKGRSDRAGIVEQLGTLGGNMSVYRYGPAGPSWGSFNLEQQGSIADEWFAGNALFAYGNRDLAQPLCQVSFR